MLCAHSLSSFPPPVYGRAGAVIPMRQLVDALAVAPSKLLLTVLWTGRDNGSTTVYEDDGASLNYTQGGSDAVRKIMVTHTATPAATDVTIQPEGTYSGAPTTRTYSLRLRWFPKMPRSVQADSGTVTWDFNAATTGGLYGDDDAFAHASGATVPVLFVDVVVDASVNVKLTIVI